MPLVKKNELGTVSISDKVMVRGIAHAIKRSGCSGDVWLATKRGRPLLEDSFLSNSEMRNAVSAQFDEEERVKLSFCVIVRFGIPIKATAERICAILAELIEERMGKPPASIKVTVTGVRSSKTARRNMELEFLYGSED